ncbi:6-phosphogluconolactonase [Nocardia anaemiae]|uniref:6-phosphogluconolactonase n=1 Tax=Nocardia anaemiae TaxID=263910 RepID=UPI000AF57732|nr:6-phosphogluconolactonase [Nocardia anaemiae]
MPVTCTFCDTPDGVATAAATLIAAQIDSAVGLSGECVVALAGGSTPTATYRALRSLDIDWSRVHFVQTDERVIPEAGERSAALIEAALGLDRQELRTRWHPVPVCGDGARTAVAYAGRLADVRPGGVPDIAILGLGTDGHTASIFSQNLHSDPGATVVSTSYHGEQRVSLGLDYLRAIPTRVLLATGTGKQAALTAALSPVSSAPRVPAAIVLGQDGHVFADAAARPERG